MATCWELRPNKFQSQLQQNPHYLPNSRQIQLLRDSQEPFNLNYLYRRGWISWEEFVWNLALSDDPTVVQSLEETRWSQLENLNPQSSASDFRAVHTLISAILSVNDNRDLARSILNHPNLHLLVERQGLLAPVLVIEDYIINEHRSFFQHLDWNYLESPQASYLVRIPGQKFKRSTIDQLKQLSIEEPLRFNQLLSRHLMSTTLSRRRIFDLPQIVEYLFTFLFYDSPSKYSLTPLLQYVEYILSSKPNYHHYASVAMNIFDRQSQDQKDFIGSLLRDLIHGGVNSRTYPLAHFLDLIKYYYQPRRLRPANFRSNWFERLSKLLPETNFNQNWLKLYFDLGDNLVQFSSLSSEQNKHLRESLIMTLVVNEDSSVFDLYQDIPLQYLFKALVSSQSSKFARKIFNHAFFNLNILPSDGVKYPVRADFYTDPCQLEVYPPVVLDGIFNIFKQLGLLHEDNPLFQRLRERILDQNKWIQLIKARPNTVFDSNQYYLMWLKSVIKEDQTNVLAFLENELVNQQFDLTVSGLDPNSWSIKVIKDQGKLREKLQRASEQLSSELNDLNPYVADQVGILATDFSIDELLLIYRSLPLPFRQEYLTYDRDQVALATINNLRGRFRDFPGDQWKIVTTLAQVIDFVNYVNLDQSGLYQAYRSWIRHYLETHLSDEIVFDPFNRDLRGPVSRFIILEPFQLIYSTLILNKFKPLDELTRLVKKSSTQRTLSFLKEANLLELMITLLNKKKYGSLFEILDRINQDAYLRRRWNQSALYLLMLLVNSKLMEDYILGKPLPDDLSPQHKQNYNLRLSLYYSADQIHSIQKVIMDYTLLVNYFNQEGEFEVTLLDDLLAQLIEEISLDEEGNLILPSELSSIDPTLLVTSENLRLAGLMGRVHFNPIMLNKLARKEEKFKSELTIYQQALTLLSRGGKIGSDYFKSVFNLTDFKDLIQTVPVFFNLVDHGQSDALTSFFTWIPEEAQSQFLKEAQQAFAYHYQQDIGQYYRSIVLNLPYEGCPSDETQIKFSPLILVPQLSSVLKILTEFYQFDQGILLSLSYEIFQNMIYHQDWEILAVYQEAGITQSDLEVPKVYEDQERTYIEILIDLLMVLGRPSDLSQIEHYYSLRGASLNLALLDTLNSQRFPVIDQIFSDLEMDFQQPDDFWLIALAELNQNRERARQLRAQFERANIPRFSETTDQLLRMISCLINQGLPTGREFYVEYSDYLVEDINEIEPDSISFKYLFRAILFKNRLDDLINLQAIYQFNDAFLQDHFGPDYLQDLLIDFKVIVDQDDQTLPDQIKEETTQLDQNLSQMIEVLDRNWTLSQSVVEESRFLLMLASGGFAQTLLILDHIFDLTIEDQDEEDEQLLMYTIDNDYPQILEILADRYQFSLSVQGKEFMFQEALERKNSRILKLLHDKLDINLTDVGLGIEDTDEIDDIELNEDDLFRLIGKYSNRETFEVLRDTYGLELYDQVERQTLLVKAAATNANYEFLEVLPQLVELDLDYIITESENIFTAISQSNDPRLTTALRILRDIYDLKADTLRFLGIHLVIMATLYNNPARLQDYREIFNLTTDDARVQDNEALIRASSRGYGEVLRVLHDDYGLGIEDARAQNNEALIEAAKGGYVEVLRLLHDLYGLGPEDARADGNEALIWAAANGHARVLRVLHEVYGLGYEDARPTEEDSVIMEAAIRGDIEVLQLLYDLYDLRKIDAQARDNGALREAAKYGQAVSLRILHDLYGLRAEDARARDNEALIFTATSGFFNEEPYVDTLILLHDVYGLGTEDARTRNNKALIAAASDGRDEILRVLHNVYGLGPEDARARNNEALIAAASNGRDEILRVLHDVYGLGPENARARNNEALILAAEHGHVFTLRALHNIYGLDAQDARSQNNKALLQAAKNSDLGVIEVLHDTYHLTREDARVLIGQIDLDQVDAMEVLDLVGELFNLSHEQLLSPVGLQEPSSPIERREPPSPPGFQAPAA